MKYFLSQIDIDKIDELNYVKENNMGIPLLLNYAMEEGFFEIKDKLFPGITSEKYQDLMLEVSQILEEEGAKEVIKDYDVFKFNKLDLDEFIHNPYYQKVQDLNFKSNDLELFKDHYEAFEPFLMDELKVDENNYFLEISPMGYFEEEFSFLSLKKKNQVWMSITPHEILTMKESLMHAKGNVLVLGLGLGYYPFMLLSNPKVKDIYVIEKDEDIINIYNTYLKDKVGSSKIKILSGDAYKFLNEYTLKKMHINYVFTDLWHNANDGLYLYLKAKSLEVDSITYSYWIEESLICYLRRYVISLVLEELSGYTDKDYRRIKNNDDKIISSLHFYLKNKEIHSYKELLNLLSSDSLKEISKHLIKVGNKK